MANSNGFQEMKKQAKEIIDERIKKSKPILKEMPPPPTPSPLITQLSATLMGDLSTKCCKKN